MYLTVYLTVYWALLITSSVGSIEAYRKYRLVLWKKPEVIRQPATLTLLAHDLLD